MANNARFFVRDILFSKENILALYEDSIIRHFIALRILEGDLVTIFNGDGNNYICSVVRVNKKNIELLLQEVQQNQRRIKAKLHLFMSVIQKDNFELIIQKAVELGVHQITPVDTSFSQRIDKNKINARLVRWQQIVVSAVEQSGQSYLPIVNSPTSLKQILSDINLHQTRSLNLVCDLITQQSIIEYDVKDVTDGINLFVGPEGGFSEEELLLFSSDLYKKVSLGRTILRAETAAILSLGCIILKLQ